MVSHQSIADVFVGVVGSTRLGEQSQAGSRAFSHPLDKRWTEAG